MPAAMVTGIIGSGGCGPSYLPVLLVCGECIKEIFSVGVVVGVWEVDLLIFRLLLLEFGLLELKEFGLLEFGLLEFGFLEFGLLEPGLLELGLLKFGLLVRPHAPCHVVLPYLDEAKRTTPQPAINMSNQAFFRFRMLRLSTRPMQLTVQRDRKQPALQQ